ncbi:MAG: glycosyltransferase family A protein [Victivallaceae bacterium]|nr:glycosyltransferase family A protein [Victivallaceae bacterium]
MTNSLRMEALRKVTFSIVIPMYNIERGIERCLRSILAQNYDAFEVLLLDDGSSDATLSRCRGMIDADPRFRLIAQPHTGRPSILRNMGLAMASCEYVIFMDSDDTLELGALEQLAASVERGGHPDVLETRFQSGFEKDGQWISTGEKYNLSSAAGVISGCGLLARIAREKRQLVCNGYSGIYRRAFLLEKELLQKETLSLYEDNEWLPRVLFAAEKVAACDSIYYHYVRSGGTMTTALSPDSLRSVAEATGWMTCFFVANQSRMPSEVRRFWANHTFNALFWYFFNPRYSRQFPSAQWRAIWNESSPVASAELRPGMIAMLPYLSWAKRLAWPLIRLISSCGLLFPARGYFALLSGIQAGFRKR